jgi:hypothetical protein
MGGKSHDSGLGDTPWVLPFKSGLTYNFMVMIGIFLPENA